MAAQWDVYEMFIAISQAPVYHLALEGFLMMWVLWLLFRKPYNLQEKTVLTLKEEDELVAEWTPEPLVPDTPQDHPALKPKVVDGRVGKYVSLNGRMCLNMVSHNYLGMLENPKVEEAAISCMRNYGVGSCGPRGFYGTSDVHIQLEDRIAKFMNLEEAVLYSYGFSTVASAIPAYAKRGDVIFVDSAVNFAIQKSLDASRSRVRFFKHNDVEDLEKILQEQAREDKKNPKKAKVTRRFLVVEGIYMNTGNICPLPELLELKKKYKVRIFIDEGISFGTLGQSGKGVTEYFNISVSEVDLICSTLEYAMGSIGGFCVGSSFIVDHQRLSSLGYCFSASLPPMLAAAAIASLSMMEEDTSMFDKLHDNCHLLHSKLEKLPGLRLDGSKDSPVKHLRLAESLGDRDMEKQILDSVAEYATKKGVLLHGATYLEKSEKFLPEASICVAVNNMLTHEEIETVAAVLNQACEQLMVYEE